MNKRRPTLHAAIGLALFLAASMLLVKVVTGWP